MGTLATAAVKTAAYKQQGKFGCISFTAWD
jgi:hypothetical protein